MRRVVRAFVLVVAILGVIVALGAPAHADDKPRLDIPAKVAPQPPDTVTPPPAPALAISEALLAAKATPSPGSARVLPCAARWLPLASESFECARAAFERGDYAAARRAFSDAARHARDLETRDAATYWEAEALWKLRRFDAAAWAFREVTAGERATPPNKWTLYGLGWAALATGTF